MKKTIVRKLVVLMLMMAMLTTMVGCSKNQDNKSVGENEQLEETSSQDGSQGSGEDEKLQPLDISWLAYYCRGVPNPEAPVIKQMEEKYNVKFNFWFLDTAKWAELLAIKISAGEVPDFMRVPRNLSKYIEQDIVGEITDEVLDKMPNYKKLLDEYVEDQDDFFLDAKMDGKLYALKSVSPGMPTTVIWRTDWLKNVGINKIPETIEEFEDAMYKFTFNDPDQNKKDDTYGMSENIMHMVFGAYGPMPLGNLTSKGECNLEFDKKDGKYVIQAIQPEMKEPLRLLQKWYKDGVIDPEFVTGENKGGYWAVSHSFVNSKIGVTGKVWPGHWRPPFNKEDAGGKVYQEMKALNPDLEFGRDFDLGFAVKGPEGISGTIGGGIGGALFAFSKQALEDPAKIDTILKMLDETQGDDAQYMLVSSGIEGVHYNMDDSGITMLEGFNTPQGLDENGIATLKSCISRPDLDEKLQPELHAYNEKYRGIGHITPKVPASKVLEKYKSDLSRYAVNFYIEVITGNKSIDEFDDFVKTFRKNGGDAIEKDVNDIYRQTIGK